MRLTSAGKPSKASRSLSMTWMPSKPTTAAASILSAKAPLNATVAMHFRSMAGVNRPGFSAGSNS